ncbi:MAG: hypothetical protein JXB46_02590 [Candidatus Eisenbacteria bacterium]|nr:hypothetical protein [Candidatus Eisenbacteria bacterium]
MDAKTRTLFGLTILLLAMLAAGCGRDNLTNPAVAPTDPVVFDDDYGSGVGPQPFQYSDVYAFNVDGTEAHSGSASLRVDVPGPEAQPEDGTYAGGALVANYARDLSQYNALTFWAKSSVNSRLNVAGLGNDNTGTSLYEAWRDSIPISTSWSRVVIPIPDGTRLQEERGLFYMAEAYESAGAFSIWFDDIIFSNESGITNPRPFMADRTVEVIAGAQITADMAHVDFELDGEDVRVGHLPGYLNYFSSNEEVAIGREGSVLAVGTGIATITAKLDTVDAAGTLTVNVLGAPEGPAPAPTVPAGDVISLFSDVYNDVPVNNWHAPWDWSTGEVRDFEIFGDNVKVYTDLNFAGVEFVGENLINLAGAGMTHFHMDVWAPSGGLFKVKLVDFGPNGYYDGPGSDDSSGELLLNGGTDPQFFSGQWSPLEIPLSTFEAAGLTEQAEHLANLVISSSDVHTVIVDNVYFHR